MIKGLFFSFQNNMFMSNNVLRIITHFINPR